MKLATVLFACLLLGCDLGSRIDKVVEKQQPNPASTPSYFQKKIECQKHQAEIEGRFSKDVSLGLQTLERIYYSPSLDTCVDIVYSQYARNPKVGSQGKILLEIDDVLTNHILWLHEYPLSGMGSKTYEEIMADTDQKIQKEGWGEK